jgi:PAS domain S-box-containing protein
MKMNHLSKFKFADSLSESEALFRNVMENAPIGMAIVSLDGYLIQVNKSFGSIVGYDKEDLEKKTFQEITYPEDLEKDLDNIQKLIKGVASSYKISKRYIRQDGKIVWAQLTVSLIKDRNEMPLYFISQIEDITEQVEAVEKLQRSEIDLKATQRIAKVGAWQWDKNSNVSFWSEEIFHLFGQNPCSPVPTLEAQMKMLSFESFKKLRVAIGNALRFGTPYEMELEICRPDGERRWIIGRGEPLRSPCGQIIGLKGTAIDVTKQKRLEEELKYALEMRDEFISIASHDLKTPITSLSLQIQLLQKAAREGIQMEVVSHGRIVKGKMITDPVLELINSASGQIDRVRNLVDDLLDLTRIRVGKLNLELVDVNLVQCVQAAADQFSTEAFSKGSTITVHASEPIIGCWDLHRVDQVISNLISNAIKYGMGKPIDIFLSKHHTKKIATLRVQDHGMGIPSHLVEKLFKRFERAGEGEKIKGLGLGLYITRQIVEAHGGVIYVETVPSQGATFIVELPLKL